MILKIIDHEILIKKCFKPEIQLIHQKFSVELIYTIIIDEGTLKQNKLI